MKNALEVSHLTKDYGSFKLDDVSFTVPGGTIMGLIGENGAGKSTTIKCILNLVRRDGGEIQVLGLDNLADERAVYLALLDDGRIVGDVFVYNWQGERDYGKIMNLAVHPAYRGRRLAAGLLRAATELLQAAGLPRICGETRLSNEAMRRTFAACGYRLTRIEEAYYDHPPESACKYERQFET